MTNKEILLKEYGLSEYDLKDCPDIEEIPTYSDEIMEILIDDGTLDNYISGNVPIWEFRRAVEQAADMADEQADTEDEDFYNKCSVAIEEGDIDEEMEPYLIGYTENGLEDLDHDISNRGDLAEDELWATGWISYPKNIEEGPFNSFDELDMYTYDSEKSMEYDLPDIGDDIKTQFLRVVNNYCEELKDIN